MKIKACIAIVAAVMISGCETLCGGSKPAGCRPIYQDTNNAMRGASALDGVPVTENGFLLENGRFSSPYVENSDVATYRKEIMAALVSERRRLLKEMAEGGNKNIENELALLPSNEEEFFVRDWQAEKFSVFTNKVTGEAAIRTGLTPMAVTTTLASVELMLDDLMNRMNSTISSALFAMRGHVAATSADINVMFQDRMQDGYDKLTEAERRALDRAQLIAVEATLALEKLEKDGFAAASDAICQTTANFANYPNTIVGLGLPIERCFSPDLLCLTGAHNIRDTGSANAEQLLQFRGINLLPNGEYPDAQILIANETLAAPASGGKSILQIPIPGGINGVPDDASLRGSKFGRVELNWPANKVKRRWAFELRPYLVRAIKVKLIPLIEGPVRTRKEQRCHVKAEGGSLGSKVETATCVITADADNRIERCTENVTSQRGDAEIRNKLQTLGACTWELRAESESWYGKGAWIDFIGQAHQSKKMRIRGRPLEVVETLNQGDRTRVFTYPAEYVPAEYKVIPGQYAYEVHIADNEGNSTILTEANPANSMGSAIIEDDRLTISLHQPFSVIGTSKAP